jgi:hypothetical protein
MSISEWFIFGVLSGLVIWGLMLIPYRPAYKEHEDELNRKQDELNRKQDDAAMDSIRGELDTWDQVYATRKSAQERIMSNELELLRKVLEALSRMDLHSPYPVEPKLIAAIRATLAAQSAPVPPDCGEAGHAEGRCGTAECLSAARRAQPAPVPVPLTEARILDLAENCAAQHHDLLEFARAIERAHGIAASPEKAK